MRAFVAGAGDQASAEEDAEEEDEEEVAMPMDLYQSREDLAEDLAVFSPEAKRVDRHESKG